MSHNASDCQVLNGADECRRQEAYEKELEKYTVRRNPLGMDRHHRYYWSVYCQPHQPSVHVVDDSLHMTTSKTICYV